MIHAYRLERAYDEPPITATVMAVFVFAESEEQARYLAALGAGSEGREVWLSADRSWITEADLKSAGVVGIWLSDFRP